MFTDIKGTGIIHKMTQYVNKNTVVQKKHFNKKCQLNPYSKKISFDPKLWNNSQGENNIAHIFRWWTVSLNQNI